VFVAHRAHWGQNSDIAGGEFHDGIAPTPRVWELIFHRELLVVDQWAVGLAMKRKSHIGICYAGASEEEYKER